MGAGCSSRRQISVSANDFPSFKIVLVGDSEVGKTSIFMRYVRNQFDYSYHPTVSVCIGNVVKKVNIPRDVIVSVAIWDLPGREEIDLRKSYYRNVDAAIVVVDVGSTDSIESASMWKQDVLSNASLSSRDSTGEEIPGDGFRCPLAIAVPVLLMGNKFDKLDYDPESGIVPDGVTALEKYADDNGFAGCVTVSARDSDGSVHNAVQALIRHLVEMKVTRHGLTRQSTQPMEGLKRIGMLNRTKEVKERLMATRIAEFDTLFSQSEPCLDDIDSSAAGFHGALSRFRRQCAVCGVGVGVHPSLEDCITALKEALGDTRLEVTNAGAFPQILISKEVDQHLDIQISKAVEMYQLEIVTHAEKVLASCPVAEAVLTGLLDEVLQLQENWTKLAAAAGLSKNSLREAETNVQSNIEKIRQSQARAVKAVQSVENAAQKVKAAMIWCS